MRRSVTLLCALALIGGCGQGSNAPVNESASTQPVEQQPSIQLPVSLNDVMVALVNDSADPIWVAAWHEPESDAEWRELERRAQQLQLAGALLAYPGTGALDKKWVVKPGWQRWAKQLQDVGSDAVEAVGRRDQAAISRVGDAVVEICEGCHIDFKLPYPTGGKFGELSPTADDLEANTE